jgi:hypothetical protein
LILLKSYSPPLLFASQKFDHFASELSIKRLPKIFQWKRSGVLKKNVFFAILLSMQLRLSWCNSLWANGRREMCWTRAPVKIKSQVCRVSLEMGPVWMKTAVCESFPRLVRQRAAASGSISACAYNEIPGQPAAVDEIAHTSNTFLRRQKMARTGGARQNLEILGARGMREIRAACAQECAAFIFQAPKKMREETM